MRGCICLAAVLSVLASAPRSNALDISCDRKPIADGKPITFKIATDFKVQIKDCRWYCRWMVDGQPQASHRLQGDTEVCKTSLNNSGVLEITCEFQIYDSDERKPYPGIVQRRFTIQDANTGRYHADATIASSNDDGTQTSQKVRPGRARRNPRIPGDEQIENPLRSAAVPLSRGKDHRATAGEDKERELRLKAEERLGKLEEKLKNLEKQAEEDRANFATQLDAAKRANPSPRPYLPRFAEGGDAEREARHRREIAELQEKQRALESRRSEPREREEQCIACSGTSQVTCNDCKGTGKIDCVKCDYKGNIECKKCNSNGLITSGFFSKTTSICSNCDGTKRIACTDCNRTKHAKCTGWLSGCGGDGKVYCGKCIGGKVKLKS